MHRFPINFPHRRRIAFCVEISKTNNADRRDKVASHEGNFHRAFLIWRSHRILLRFTVTVRGRAVFDSAKEPLERVHNKTVAIASCHG